MDLPVWQALYEELGERGLVVIAVALDSRDDAARPWIEAAKPTYPVLIDREHRLAELYHMVNVPQAVWIDERGRIVRPVEVAGAYEGFRSMDRETFQMPPEEVDKSQAARATYLDAIRDWVVRGEASELAYGEEAARAHTTVPDEAVARAHACFRLGQHLKQGGRDEEGRAWVEEAIQLHPESWAFWRQHAEPSVMGLAAGPEFWERVDALGESRYYARVDIKGMP